MNISKFTQKSLQAVNGCEKLAYDYGNQEIEQRIMAELGRGITYWTAKGGYTGEDVDVLYTVCSKYEVAHLRRIVHDINPQAFMVVKEGLSIRGNFTRKLH